MIRGIHHSPFYRGEETSFSKIIGRRVNGCLVDSTNVTEKKNKCLGILRQKEFVMSKFQAADFLANKLYDIIYLTPEDKETIADCLSQAILDNETLPDPVRLHYLRFRNTQVSTMITERAIRGGLRRSLEIAPYLQVLRYCLRSTYSSAELRGTVLREFGDIFEAEETSLRTRMEIADILILNGMRTRGEEMLEEIRREERGQEVPPVVQGVVRTVYEDTQNVHDSNINESVLKACIGIMAVYRPEEMDTEERTRKLVDRFPDQEEDIKSVMERVCFDTARFSHGDDTFSLYNLVSSLFQYIDKHKERDELYSRLVEEMVSMNRYCSTGHLSRFVNVIQGFTEDPDLCVRISDEQQVASSIMHRLNKIMEGAREEIMDAMISDTPEKFHSFLADEINKCLPEWRKEYGTDLVNEELPKIVTRYTRYPGWEIENDKKLVFKEQVTSGRLSPSGTYRPSQRLGAAPHTL